MNPYDDDRYLEWCRELAQLVNEFLNTEGNTPASLTSEFENALENAEVDDDDTPGSPK